MVCACLALIAILSHARLQMHDMAHQCSAVELLLVHYNEIFRPPTPVPPSPSSLPTIPDAGEEPDEAHGSTTQPAVTESSLPAATQPTAQETEQSHARSPPATPQAAALPAFPRGSSSPEDDTQGRPPSQGSAAKMAKSLSVSHTPVSIAYMRSLASSSSPPRSPSLPPESAHKPHQSPLAHSEAAESAAAPAPASAAATDSIDAQLRFRLDELASATAVTPEPPCSCTARPFVSCLLVPQTPLNP